jgi:hypothetical protein
MELNSHAASGAAYRREVRTLGDASVNLCYAVEEKAAFAEARIGIAGRPAVAA